MILKKENNIWEIRIWLGMRGEGERRRLFFCTKLHMSHPQQLSHAHYFLYVKQHHWGAGGGAGEIFRRKQREWKSEAALTQSPLCLNPRHSLISTILCNSFREQLNTELEMIACTDRVQPHGRSIDSCMKVIEFIPYKQRSKFISYLLPHLLHSFSFLLKKCTSHITSYWIGEFVKKCVYNWVDSHEFIQPWERGSLTFPMMLPTSWKQAKGKRIRAEK